MIGVCVCVCVCEAQVLTYMQYIIYEAVCVRAPPCGRCKDDPVWTRQSLSVTSVCIDWFVMT